MSGQGEYAYGRSTGANETPLFTSDNWNTLAKGFENIAKYTAIGALAAKAVAARDPEPETKVFFAMIAQAARETATVAMAAAALALEQARQAKVDEDRKEAAAREAQRQRSERARIEADRVAKVNADLDRGWRVHQDRVNRGEFLREYRDTQTHERAERFNKMA